MDQIDVLRSARAPAGDAPRRPDRLAIPTAATKDQAPPTAAAGRTSMPSARSDSCGVEPSEDPPAFPISSTARVFYERHYPEATEAELNDWRWQSRARLRTLAQLDRTFRLSDEERKAIRLHQGSLPVGITPYYASLMSAEDPTEPLRRTHLPVLDEYLVSPGEAGDPLDEDRDMVAPNLVRRYPDRVLFLVSGFCFTYCRYCTRSRLVGDVGGDYHFSARVWDEQIEFIASHPEIRDCLISGGDPLTLATGKLDMLLSRLRGISHLEFLRIGTKAPVVLPQRVTPRLAKMLGRHRVWLQLHFTHPSELTPEVAFACNRLADAGVPLASQTVLLKGINDSPSVMKELMHGLLRIRVRPYYLYQCDPILGSSHFRTPVAKGLEIIEQLRGHTTGHAVPQFVVDAPGGGGKIPLLPDYRAGRDGDDLLLRNYEGQVFRYRDQEPHAGVRPPRSSPAVASALGEPAYRAAPGAGT